MKRIAALLPLLSACEGPPADAPESRIECAVDGASAFARVCTFERKPDGLITLRSPSGSFRRLVATEDGNLAAADGAEPATVKPLGKEWVEVSIAGDRYRLPAQLR